MDSSTFMKMIFPNQSQILVKSHKQGGEKRIRKDERAMINNLAMEAEVAAYRTETRTVYSIAIKRCKHKISLR